MVAVMAEKLRVLFVDDDPAAARLYKSYLVADGHEVIVADSGIEAVEATASGKLAFALLQVGQRDRAEAALRMLWPQAQAEPTLGRAIMMVAERTGMPLEPVGDPGERDDSTVFGVAR